MKSIRSADDLAINGAQPAFSSTLHVGSPNLGSRAEFDQYVDGIYKRNWLTNDGPLVRELEDNIATMHRVEHCVAMTNGTVALEIAVRALELEGEVVVPSYTFVATAHALHWQAIKPVFADIDPVTHNLDPVSVRRAITPETSGIIGVHLWGRCAPVEELESIAEEHGIGLMFDAAHAFGCSHKGQMIGGFGNCEVLSFHATKFFNSFEGGAVLTNDGELADKMRLMRNFGFKGMDNVIYPGTNGKMSEICAAMGLVNLAAVDGMRQVNRRTYDCFQSALSSVPQVRLIEYDEAETNNYQYMVLEIGPDSAASRDELMEALRAENVIARRYFWPGCHRMEPYASGGVSGQVDLDETEKIAARNLVLPAGKQMSEEGIEVIVDVIRLLAQGV